MKRFLILMASIVLAISTFAQSYSGRTYSTTVRESGAKITLTVKFTSATRGVLTFQGSGNGKNASDKMAFSYEVSGDIINVYPDTGNGDIGYFVIGDYDNIMVTDDYGNVVFDLKRVASSSASSGKSSGKKSSKRKR